MIVTLERIVADVRLALGENPRFDTLLRIDDSETLTLNRQIEFWAAPTACDLTLAAPRQQLDSPRPFAAPDTLCGNCCGGRGAVRLPDDFLRLASFRLEGWSCGLTLLDSDADAVAVRLLRSCAMPGLLADNTSPTGLITHYYDGDYLEFFASAPPADTGPVIAEAYYWPRPRFDRHGGMEVSRGIYDRLIASVAARVSNNE